MLTSFIFNSPRALRNGKDRFFSPACAEHASHDGCAPAASNERATVVKDTRADITPQPEALSEIGFEGRLLTSPAPDQSASQHRVHRRAEVVTFRYASMAAGRLSLLDGVNPDPSQTVQAKGSALPAYLKWSSRKRTKVRLVLSSSRTDLLSMPMLRRGVRT